MGRDPLDYFVLDSLANDLEALEDVLRILNSDAIGWRTHHPEPFTKDEVVPTLCRCIRDGLVRAAVLGADGKYLEPLEDRALPTCSVDDVWFELTARGRIVHSTWEPPQAAS
jgi:hypothetical protein